MQTNKFSIERSDKKHQPQPQIHFLSYVPKVLSIADAAQLISELVDAINDKELIELTYRNNHENETTSHTHRFDAWIRDQLTKKEVQAVRDHNARMEARSQSRVIALPVPAQNNDVEVEEEADGASDEKGVTGNAREGRPQELRTSAGLQKKRKRA